MPGARKSAKYLFIGGLFSKGISFVGTIILARILFPEDFGYLMIAMIVTGFLQVIGDMGFENYYLQEKITSKEQEEKILNITYKLRLGVNFFLFLMQIALSYIVEIYYNNDVIGELLRIFSLNILIMAFSQINLYILRKQLNYKPEVYANIGRDIVSTIFKILFAATGFGALSFAIGAILGNIMRLAILLRYQSFKPIWTLWDKFIFEHILFYGKHSFLSGLGAFFSNQLDKLFLTLYFPQTTSGNYYFSGSQASSIFSYIISPQASLILSYSAKHKHNKEYLFVILTNISYFIGIIMLPIVIYLIVYAEPLFDYLFGQKWHDSVILFQIFLFYYFITELTFPFSGILTAFGLPHIASRLVLARLLALILLLPIPIYFSTHITIYLLVFLIISTIFSYLKAYISIHKMKQKFSIYVSIWKNLMLYAALYGILLFIVNISVQNILWQLMISLVSIILSSLLLHLLFFRERFIQSLETIIHPTHPLFQYIKG